MSDSERKSSPGIKDIGTFVENYERLLDKLFPVFAVWDAAVYVARYAVWSAKLYWDCY